MSKEIAESRSDRINICELKHGVYKSLTEGLSAPFKTMKDVFLTAAAIAAQKGTRKPIEKNLSGGIFAWSVFSVQEDIPLLYALVLSAGEPLETLLDNGKILDIVEEYANAGISDLEEDVLSSAHPSLALANKLLSEAKLPEQNLSE